MDGAQVRARFQKITDEEVKSRVCLKFECKIINLIVHSKAIYRAKFSSQNSEFGPAIFNEMQMLFLHKEYPPKAMSW